MLGLNMENILRWVCDDQAESLAIKTLHEKLEFAREMRRNGHDQSFFASCMAADYLSEVFPHAVESLPGVHYIDQGDENLCEGWGMSFWSVAFRLETETPSQKTALERVLDELDTLYDEYQALARVYEDEFAGEYGDWTAGSFTLTFRDLYENGGGNADWAAGGEHLAMYRILRRFGELCEQVTNAA